MRNLLSWLILLLSVSACTSPSLDDVQEVDRLNDMSYRYRYVNVDSCLYYANQARSMAVSYPEGEMEAMCNLAYVAWQQMHYDQALYLLQKITSRSRSKIELLCAEVMRMRVYQRISDGKGLFAARNNALDHLRRIDEAYKVLDVRQCNRVESARSELHTISCTYYYYMGMDSLAWDEFYTIDPQRLARTDTAQLLNYEYFLGSGGLQKGDSATILMNEFDHLFEVCLLGSRQENAYFQANAFQSLAVLLAHPGMPSAIYRERPFKYAWLVSQHPDSVSVPSDDSLSLSFLLTSRAIELFRTYKDAYQVACAYRTLGELYFKQVDYENAMDCFLRAQRLLESRSNEGNSIVTPCESMLAERLSMAYSAVGNRKLSQVYRNRYLDYLDLTRQDLELDSRRALLTAEVSSVRWRLLLLVGLILLSLLLARLVVRRVKKRSALQVDNLMRMSESEAYRQMLQCNDERMHEIEEQMTECEEQLEVSRLNVERYRIDNVSRRAKVSLATSVIPFLDRMLDAIHRLSRDSVVSRKEILEYIEDLSKGIIHVQSVLNSWIGMHQGMVNLHVSVFPIREVLDIVSRGHHSFEQKGIRLIVDESDSMVRADQVLTLFMVNTLTDNARKFTSDGGTVHVEVTSNDEYVEIGISDTGVGISPEDVDLLNHSKVYDPAKIGVCDDRKGFGFGIMNCKGIINKYKKSSSLFSSCDFGVSSKVGEGSRFWFRLPRVLSVLFLVCTSLHLRANSLQAMYDSLYQANVEGRYEEALQWGEQAECLVTTPMDTMLVMNLHNEMAVAALALCDWDTYRLHNGECVRLHRLYTRDDSIPSYCRQMSRHRRDGKVLYVLLTLFSLVALILFVLLFLRSRIRHDKRVSLLSGYITRMFSLAASSTEAEEVLGELEELHAQSIRSVEGDDSLLNIESSLYEKVREQLTRRMASYTRKEEMEENLHRISFEENRLYVQNQILDNSLSTLKHETMYGPSRTLQMVEAMKSDEASSVYDGELCDFVTYYHDIYSLLCMQATMQMKESILRIAPLYVPDCLQSFDDMLQRRIQRSQLACSFRLENVSPVSVQADSELLECLLLSLCTSFLPLPCSLVLSCESDVRFASFSLSCTGISCPVENLDDFFSPGDDHIPYLTARQILREHDAVGRYPGLRLYAEPMEDGFRFLFTLLKV